jgi:phosphoenolpyruvate carboxykinase (GTP)
MRARLNGLFDGCMAGRTMYVVPFSMGPLGSEELSALGVEITDSGYVAISMGIMTRMGQPVLDLMGDGRRLRPGRPHPRRAAGRRPGGRAVALQRGQVDRPLPETREIWSYGSGYGGNALLGKKCYALRIASVMARDEGWLAEHMLILKLTDPKGRAKYVAAAFPVGLRQDQPRHAPADHSGLEGRDHRRRHRLDALRRRRAPVCREPGSRLLRRRARHQPATPTSNALATMDANTVFTNTALTADGDVWWEGLTEGRPRGPDQLEGSAHDAGLGRRPQPIPTPASPCPPRQCPTIAPEWEDPKGVPIDAILFGGRRASAVPLVTEAFDWEHGVFMGSSVASEGTAAAENARSGPCAAIPSPCCPSAATTWATISPTGCRWPARPTPRSCRASTSSTGSARVRTASSSGPVSATMPAC